MSEATANQDLSREEIRRIFRRHKGAIQRVADELGRSHTAVWLWLHDRMNSAPIAAVAQRHAQRLLAIERGEVAA